MILVRYRPALYVLLALAAVGVALSVADPVSFLAGAVVAFVLVEVADMAEVSCE